MTSSVVLIRFIAYEGNENNFPLWLGKGMKSRLIDWADIVS